MHPALLSACPDAPTPQSSNRCGCWPRRCRRYLDLLSRRPAPQRRRRRHRRLPTLPRATPRAVSRRAHRQRVEPRTARRRDPDQRRDDGGRRDPTQHQQAAGKGPAGHRHRSFRRVDPGSSCCRQRRRGAIERRGQVPGIRSRGRRPAPAALGRASNVGLG